MKKIVDKLEIEKTEDDKIYLIVGARRRRVMSKTELRTDVGNFIRGL